MIKGVRGPDNIPKVRPALKMFNVRNINVDKLTNNNAVKPTLLQWHISRNYFGASMLNKMLSLDMPFLDIVKDEFCRMDDAKVLAESNKILNEFINNHIAFLGSNTPPTLIEFIESTKDQFNTWQFYSGTLSHCSAFSSKIDGDPTLTQNIHLIEAVKKSFRDTLVFTASLEVLSRKHDFAPFTKKLLLCRFPQLEKKVSPCNYLDILSAEQIFSVVNLLKYIDEEMKIGFNDIDIDPVSAFDKAAVIKTGRVMIKLPALLKFSPPFYSNIEKHLLIEK